MSPAWRVPLIKRRAGTATRSRGTSPGRLHITLIPPSESNHPGRKRARSVPEPAGQGGAGDACGGRASVSRTVAFSTLYGAVRRGESGSVAPRALVESIQGRILAGFREGRLGRQPSLEEVDEEPHRIREVERSRIVGVEGIEAVRR